MRKTIVARTVRAALGKTEPSIGTRFTVNHLEYIDYPSKHKRDMLELDAWLVDVSTPNFKVDDPMRSMENLDDEFIPYGGPGNYLRSQPIENSFTGNNLFVTRVLPKDAVDVSDGEIYQRVGRGMSRSRLGEAMMSIEDDYLSSLRSLESLVPTSLHFGTAVKREVQKSNKPYALDFLLKKELGTDKVLYNPPRPDSDITPEMAIKLALIGAGIEEQLDSGGDYITPCGNKYANEDIAAQLTRALITPTPELIKAIEASMSNDDNVAFSVRSVGSRIPDELLDSPFKLTQEDIEEMKRAGYESNESLLKKLGPQAGWLRQLPVTDKSINVKDIPEIDISECYPKYKIGEDDED